MQAPCIVFSYGLRSIILHILFSPFIFQMLYTGLWNLFHHKQTLLYSKPLSRSLPLFTQRDATPSYYIPYGCWQCYFPGTLHPCKNLRNTKIIKVKTILNPQSRDKYGCIFEYILQNMGSDNIMCIFFAI